MAKEKTFNLQFRMFILCMLTTLSVGGVVFSLEILCSLLIILAITPYISSKTPLTLHNGRKINPDSAITVYQMVSQLSKKAKLDVEPVIYYLDSAKFIAFTVGGSKKPAIAVSDGLLNRLNLAELHAVIAHEIAHIKNQDIKKIALATMMSLIVVTLTMLTLVKFLFDVPFALFDITVLPVLSLLFLVAMSIEVVRLRMKLSQTREFEADRCAAIISNDPIALISALEKLEYPYGKWIQQLFFVRSEPSISEELHTHPLFEDRIERLKAIAMQLNLSKKRFDISKLNFATLSLSTPKHLREIRISIQ